MNDLPNIMLAALPAFALLMLVEGLYAWRAGNGVYRGSDTTANIALGLGSMVIGVLSAGAMLLFLSWLYSYRLWDIPVNASWAWALCFFADDFSYYWFHRLSHEVRWFWASHSVHHSSEQYNFSVAVRQTWTGIVSGSFLFWFWMPLVGFHPKMVLFMQSISLIYQFWIHTQAIDKLPAWFEAIFNTPSHHRVHHGSDFDYLDANYAGTLIIWDRLFRSHVPETFKPTYGLTSSIGTDNPIRIAFHEWKSIVRDLRKSRSLGTAFNILFQPPGWSADGSSMTTQQARKAALGKEQRD